MRNAARPRRTKPVGTVTKLIDTDNDAGSGNKDNMMAMVLAAMLVLAIPAVCSPLHEPSGTTSSALYTAR